MIIWITGQPASGKTTLAKYLTECFVDKTYRVIDGDVFRHHTANNDYSEQGRRLNVERIMIFALGEEHYYDYIIVAAVSPFKDQRDWIKTKANVKEIYLTSSRQREGRMVEYYSPPTNNYLHIDTDTHSMLETQQKALTYILT
jgi:adenylylsulfate kinase-like enzyme